MGIVNPTKSSDEFRASVSITQNLTNIIFNQERDFRNYNAEEVKIMADVKKDKEKRLESELKSIKDLVNERTQRIIDLAQEKGAGAWLTALPIQSLGFTLNKQEFRDGVCLRYGWSIPNTPNFCQCGEENNIDHTLSCKKGGYVAMRHNRLRDLEADLMREVCHNVQVEPELLPIDNDGPGRGNRAEKARLDVAGVGVWGAYEKTFLDIRVMHPNAPSYADKSIEQVHVMHENEKKESIQ